MRAILAGQAERAGGEEIRRRAHFPPLSVIHAASAAAESSLREFRKWKKLPAPRTRRLTKTRFSSRHPGE